jgi:hypothetical protein
MTHPGRFRSARQKYGPRGSGIDGPHQASSIRPVAAPSRWLEPAGGDQDAAPGPDQDLLAVPRDADSRDPAVGGDQVGQRGIQPHRHAAGEQPGPQPRGERLSEAEHPLSEQAAAGQPARDLDAGEDGARMPRAQGQPPVVGLGDRDAAGDGQVGPVQPGEFAAKYRPVERHRLDAAPSGQPAWCLGVVVGIAGHPGEPQRRRRQDEVQHRRAVLQQRVLQLRWDVFPCHLR